jgi:vacuolar protein sorting-associated protein 18
MKNRCYTLTSNYQKCEICNDVLLGKQFYLFPCSHGFHCGCLQDQAAHILPPNQLAALESLQDNLKALINRNRELDSRSKAQYETIQAEIDSYVSADCPLCGYAMINLLMQPLLDESAIDESKQWAL